MPSLREETIDSELVDPTKVDFLREFWFWVSERQNIYLKRNAGKKPPWTDDPTLRDYFFTNPYRENDEGTVYYLNNIATLGNSKDVVFDTLAYRYFNNEPTWDFLCELFKSDHVPWGKWNSEDVAYALTQWERDGHQVFTSAFTVTGVRFGGYPDKISNVCWLVEYFQLQTKLLLKVVLEATNLKQIFTAVLGLQGMGAFLAYEIAIDFSYTWLVKGSVTENDFVNPGPGCRFGLNYIFPGRQDYTVMINELRLDQDKAFKRYGFKWRRDNPELTLRSIEHSLCEFGKYARTKYGVKPDKVTKTSSKTRRYTPHT